MVDVKITYETLFDLLRRERGRDEIQELDPGFYDDVLTYLTDKKAILDGISDPESSEAEKTRIQLQNIKKIVKELYERREKKILLLAINKIRTGSNVIDTSFLMNPVLY
jgi:DNA replication initiation complex subunit (GINS family)